MTSAPARPMRVSMLVLNAFTHDTRVEKEARTLTDAGYEVTVVAQAAADLPEREIRDGYQVIRVPRPMRRIPVLRFLAYRRRIEAVLEASQPDILHAHDSDALTAVGTVARRRDVPYIYDAHELWLGQPPRDRGPLYSAASRALYTRVERRFIPRASAWLTVSEPIARHLERRYHLPRVDLVPNYPEPGEAPHPREIRSLPGAESIPPDAPLLLHLGGIRPERGIGQLIRSLAELPAVHLALLGATPSAWATAIADEVGVSDRVHYLALVPSSEVIDYAASATIGVATVIPVFLNARYSLPNKLFQYLAAGLPVVASALPQMRDIVEGAGAGVTADTRDPHAIASAVRSLLDSDELSEMGRRGRRAVEERYNWEASASVLREAYARVVSARPVPRQRPRLLAVTRIWPSRERPGLGIFVSNRFRDVPDVTVIVARPNPNAVLGMVRFLWDALRVRGRFDGVEAHVLYPAGLIGLVVARLRGVPLLAYAHGTDVRSVGSRGPLYRFGVRTVARHADLVVTNSKDSAELVRQLGGSAEILPPGFDATLFRPSPRTDGARRVLYLGGGTHAKGYDIAQGLADTLAGPGVRDVAPAEVARLMAEHDVVLVPSRAEGFGMVAVEAIASGRWVVARAVGGLPEIVRHGINGTLVTRDEDFAAAVAAVPDYEPESIARTVERFSLERWQAAMAAAWDRLLARTR